jgi:DedD protein
VESPAKERLTGALILVAALVIIVPEMLSGPDDVRDAAAPAAPSAAAGPPMRTYNLELGTAVKGSAGAQSSLTPEAAGSAAADAAEAAVPPPVTASAAEPASPPSAAIVAPAPLPAAADEASPAPDDAPVAATPPAAQAPVRATPAAPGGSGRWWVQLGSFSARENAERLERQLRAAGFGVDVSQVRAGGKELFRVRAGPVRDRPAAVALQGRLAAMGHKAALVAP